MLALILILGVVPFLPRTADAALTDYRSTAAADSVEVSVVFTATGGTVTSSGLYTAGTTAGTYRIIAASGGLADTATITLIPPAAAAPPAVQGIPFGPWHVPLDSLGKPGFPYNGGTLNGYGPTLKASLERVRAGKGRVALSLLRAETKDATGRLSVAATESYLATWPDISDYIADGTVIGVIVSDDIGSAKLWGREVPPLGRIDSLALLVKNRWPSAVTMVRAKPTQLRGRAWQWLETAWAQYDGPYRDGTPEKYREAQVASAKAQRLGLVLWMNVLDGGCGPTSACRPSVPGPKVLGTFVNAERVRRYQMSPQEVLNYGLVFLAEPYNCAAIHWQWSPGFKYSGRTAGQLADIQAFDTRPEVREVMTALGKVAAQRAPTNCRQ
jgi:hypothetical protein